MSVAAPKAVASSHGAARDSLDISTLTYKKFCGRQYAVICAAVPSLEGGLTGKGSGGTFIGLVQEYARSLFSFMPQISERGVSKAEAMRVSEDPVSFSLTQLPLPRNPHLVEFVTKASRALPIASQNLVVMTHHTSPDRNDWGIYCASTAYGFLQEPEPLFCRALLFAEEEDTLITVRDDFDESQVDRNESTRVIFSAYLVMRTGPEQLQLVHISDVETAAVTYFPNVAFLSQGELFCCDAADVEDSANDVGPSKGARVKTFTYRAPPTPKASPKPLRKALHFTFS